MIEARYWHSAENKDVVCDLCPHRCRIADGRRGICGSRENRDGKLWALSYGHPCALAIDPVEKKPLREFHPSTECLSLACTGCNFRCLNCQNWEISQAKPEDAGSEEWSPRDIVGVALERKIPGIAYTYTEPLTWYEYMYDIAELAHGNGLWNILVSAGYVEEEPLRTLAPLLDAANIDLKSLSDSTYRHVSGGTLDPVLRTLRILREEGVHVEVTNLLIPGVNDSPEQIRSLCRWLAGNGYKDNPLHFSRFFPMYKMLDRPETPLSSLRIAWRISHEEGLSSVFLGNLSPRELAQICGR